MFVTYKYCLLVLVTLTITSCGNSGPPNPNPNWGNCYNSAYIRNHPEHSRVDDPVFTFLGNVYVRKEVLECRNEFIQWLRESHISQLRQLQAEFISCYIETDGSEKCLGR